MPIPPRRRTRRSPSPWMKARTSRLPRGLRHSVGAVERGTRHGWLTVLAPWAAVAATVLALIFTNLASADQLRAQEEANRAQQQLTEQGQITDRFGRAI